VIDRIGRGDQGRRCALGNECGISGTAQHSALVQRILTSLTPRKVVVNSKGGES